MNLSSLAVYRNADPVLAQAVRWADEGRRVALATVVRTWGSAPRRAGSHMAVAGSGEFAGSVSGGCIEGAVVHASLEVIESGAPRAMEFGVTNEMAWEVGLACGGRVELFVERVSAGGGASEGAADPGLALLRRIRDAQEEGRDVLLATRLHDGCRALADGAGADGAGADGAGADGAGADGVSAAGLSTTGVSADEGGVLGVPAAQVRAALRSAESRVAEAPDGPVFLRPYARPPHLVVVGAVHIAQALAPLATVAGFRVTVVDPREGFATDRRFPGSTMVREWPDQALPRLGLDHRSAVAALTHDPKLDDPALLSALASDAFYVGALGSRKTQEARRERLAAAGCSPAALDRIRGPIGLPIGAKTPEEIALATLAEVVAALRLEGKLAVALNPDR